MLVIVSCSQMDDAEKSTEFSNKVVDATFRTSDDAALIAMRFSRSSATREAETKSVKSVVIARGSYTRSNDSTLVYAVNFNDDKGYVLVPARKDLPGVLAVIDKGNFNALEIESNPNASFMMDRIGTYVQQGSLRKPSTPPGYYDTIFSGTRTVLPVVDVDAEDFQYVLYSLSE